MKKRRLFILICAMLICIATVGCSKDENKNLEAEAETQEMETQGMETQEMEKTSIKTSMAVQYSDREVSIYSNTSCFFTFDANITDVGCVSTNNYGPFEISAGEKVTFTIDELSPNFFSEEAKIQEISSLSPFVYGDSPLDIENYHDSNANIEFKCYTDKFVLRSNEDCFVCLTLQTNDENFGSGQFYLERLKVNANEITTFNLENLAPGFYSDKAEIISYSSLSINSYKEEP